MYPSNLLYRSIHYKKNALKYTFFAILGLSLLGGCRSESATLKDQNHSPTLDNSLSTELPSFESSLIRNQLLGISGYPEVISKECGDGNAKLFDECGDQTEILKQAIASANQQGDKNVLVSYGGEWCIWCHVLDRYFNGQFRTFDYQWRDSDGDVSEWLMQEQITSKDIEDAIALNNFVANNFVIAHIDNSYANGAEAIAMTGLDPDAVYYYPYIIVLDKQGKYVGEMASSSALEGLEIRESAGEEFRGYNRELLLVQLKSLKNKAKLPQLHNKKTC